MESMKEAMEYMVNLGKKADTPQVLEICGKTYGNRELVRYGKAEKARPISARTLSSLSDYIENCSGEFPDNMIIHIVSPKEVRLMSALDKERERETLFVAEAEVSEFRFDSWYDQERFMIELQSNFQENEDLKLVMKLAGNVEQKNNQSYSDDGVTQVATMTVGAASKADVVVPNPVELIPHRTFQEVEQPSSKFVFRIGSGEQPSFKLIEAEGGIWRNEAVANIKDYLFKMLEEMPEEIRDRVVIIG